MKKNWSAERRAERMGKYLLSRKLLLRMIVSYIVVALIPLIFSNIMAGRRTSEIIDRKKQEIVDQLDMAQLKYDNAIFDLEKVCSVVVSEDELLTVGAMKNPIEERSNVYAFLQAQRRMSLLAKSYDILDQMILYNIPEQFAITDSTTYMNIELLPAVFENHNQGYRWPRNLLASLSAEKRYKRQWSYLNHEEDDKAIALYTNTVYLDKNNNVLIQMLSPSKLSVYLKIDNNSEIVVFNQEGKQLSDSHMLPFEWEDLASVTKGEVLTDANGHRYYVAAVHSKATEHLLISVTDYTVIENAVFPIRTTNALYILTIVICTLLMIVWVARVSMRPLSDILSFLFDKDALYVSTEIDWQTINERIHSVVDENAVLSDSLKAQHESMKNSLVYDLIHNGDVPGDRIQWQTERLNVSRQQKYWLVVFDLLAQNESPDAVAFSLLIHQAIQFHFEDVFNISEMTAKRYCVVLQDHDQSEEDMKACYRTLYQELEHSLHTQIQGCISRCASLREIGSRYWDMVMSIETDTADEDGLVCIDTMREGIRELMFPQQLEQRIITAIVNGNQDIMENSLNELYDINNQAIPLHSLAVKLLWERVCAIITIALMRSKDVPDILQIKTLQALHAVPEAENRYQFTHNALAKLDAVMLLTKKESNISLHRSELGRKIVEYIQQHLTEPELCVQSLVDHFQFSTTYISMLIRDETGTTFSAYCEKLRMANACELLRQGKQIQEVAMEVGYTSPHTFRRVFKKVVGVLPSEYSQH